MFLKRSLTRRSAQVQTPPSSSSRPSSPSAPSPLSTSTDPPRFHQVRKTLRRLLFSTPSTPSRKRISVADISTPTPTSVIKLDIYGNPLPDHQQPIRLSSSTSSSETVASSSSSLETAQTSSTTANVGSTSKEEEVTLKALMEELGIEREDQRRFLRTHSSKEALSADRIIAIIEHEMLIQVSHKRDEMIYRKTLHRTLPETNCVHDAFHPANASKLSEGEKAMMLAKDAIFRALLLREAQISDVVEDGL